MTTTVGRRITVVRFCWRSNDAKGKANQSKEAPEAKKGKAESPAQKPGSGQEVVAAASETAEDEGAQGGNEEAHEDVE